MSNLKSIFQGIFSIYNEINIEKEFVTSFQKWVKYLTISKVGKREEIFRTFYEETFRTLYQVSREYNKIKIFEQVFTEDEFLFFTRRVKEKIEQSTLEKNLFSNITENDAEIIKYGIMRFSGYSSEMVQILERFSLFINNFILSKNFTYDMTRNFFENVYLFQIIFYSTLGILKAGAKEELEKIKDLYQHKMFEYYVIYEDHSDTPQLQEIVTMLSILWTLVKGELSLNPDTTIGLMKEQASPYNNRARKLLSNIFSIFSQIKNTEVKKYLEILFDFELLYDFFINLENTDDSEYPSLVYVKSKNAENFVELLEENEAFKENNLYMLIDFSIFLNKNIEKKYLNLIKNLCEVNECWFEDLVLENLKNDHAIHDTMHFLLISDVKKRWTNKIKKGALDILRKKLKQKPQYIFDESEKGKNLFFKLLNTLIETKGRLHLNYTTLGKIIFEETSKFLKGARENSEIVTFLMGKISYILNKEDADLLVGEILNFVKENMREIIGENLGTLLETSKKLKVKLLQGYLEDIGKNLITSQFESNFARNFLILLKKATKFKDNIGLIKNIEDFKKDCEDEELLVILEGIEEAIKNKRRPRR